MEKTIEELIYQETDERLKEMCKDDYEYPSQADRRDVLGICIMIGISLLLIILCMMGVIK